MSVDEYVGGKVEARDYSATKQAASSAARRMLE